MEKILRDKRGTVVRYRRGFPILMGWISLDPSWSVPVLSGGNFRTLQFEGVRVLVEF